MFCVSSLLYLAFKFLVMMSLVMSTRPCIKSLIRCNTNVCAFSMLRSNKTNFILSSSVSRVNLQKSRRIIDIPLYSICVFVESGVSHTNAQYRFFVSKMNGKYTFSNSISIGAKKNSFSLFCAVMDISNVSFIEDVF